MVDYRVRDEKPLQQITENGRPLTHVNPISSEVIAELVPKAKLVKVEGGSHGFFAEMSGRFNREVLDFLGSRT